MTSGQYFQPGDRRRQAQIRALRFEQFVIGLLIRRSGWQVEPDKQIAPGVIADAYATDEHGNTYLLEVKYTSPQTGRRIQDALNTLTRVRDALPKETSQSTMLVLVFGGVLSDQYRRVVESRGVVLWDANTLLDWAEDYPDLSAEYADIFDVDRSESYLGYEIPDIAAIPCGRDFWPQYQKWVSEVLEYLFCPPLKTPFIENSNEEGVKRRDIILPNYSDTGFWNYMAVRYSADYIVADAKNYCGNIGKNQILQVSNYLSEGGTGLFALNSHKEGNRHGWPLHLP